MEDEYFLDLARRLIGKQVRIGFIAINPAAVSMMLYPKQSSQNR